MFAPSSPVGDGASIILDGNEYMLLPKELGGEGRWKVVSKEQPRFHVPRRNVQPGAMDGTYVLQLNDWSQGVADESDIHQPFKRSGSYSEYCTHGKKEMQSGVAVWPYDLSRLC